MNYTLKRSKINAKYQTTIPKQVREILNAANGDSLHFSIFENGIVIKKVRPLDTAYYKMLDESLSEWHSKEDDEAFASLQ